MTKVFYTNYGYNDMNVYCGDLAPGTVSLPGDRARAATVNNALTVTYHKESSHEF